MSLLYSAGSSNYIGVADLAAASAWYIEKLGLRKVDVELDDGDDCVALGFGRDDFAFCLGPAGRDDGSTPRLSASNAKKTREWLVSRGVAVGDLQKDGQGTRSFEMRDPFGNAIEICEEP